MRTTRVHSRIDVRQLRVSFLLFRLLPTHFLRRPSTDILETFPHDVDLDPKETLLCPFPESAP